MPINVHDPMHMGPPTPPPPPNEATLPKNIVECTLAQRKMHVVNEVALLLAQEVECTRPLCKVSCQLTTDTLHTLRMCRMRFGGFINSFPEVFKLEGRHPQQVITLFKPLESLPGIDLSSRRGIRCDDLAESLRREITNLLQAQPGPVLLRTVGSAISSAGRRVLTKERTSLKAFLAHSEQFELTGAAGESVCLRASMDRNRETEVKPFSVRPPPAVNRACRDDMTTSNSHGFDRRIRPDQASTPRDYYQSLASTNHSHSSLSSEGTWNMWSETGIWQDHPEDRHWKSDDRQWRSDRQWKSDRPVGIVNQCFSGPHYTPPAYADSWDRARSYKKEPADSVNQRNWDFREEDRYATQHRGPAPPGLPAWRTPEAEQHNNEIRRDEDDQAWVMDVFGNWTRIDLPDGCVAVHVGTGPPKNAGFAPAHHR